MTENSERDEPTENADRNEPTEPIESADPTEPIDRNEPLEPIDSIEFSDHNDHRDPIVLPGLTPPTVSCAPLMSRRYEAALSTIWAISTKSMVGATPYRPVTRSRSSSEKKRSAAS